METAEGTTVLVMRVKKQAAMESAMTPSTKATNWVVTESTRSLRMTRDQ